MSYLTTMLHYRQKKKEKQNKQKSAKSKKNSAVESQEKCTV